MHVLVSLVFVLIACLSARAEGGQQPPSSTLAAAERALAMTLANHDRAAFVAMFDADAESTLPSVTRGPQAIAEFCWTGSAPTESAWTSAGCSQA